MAISGTGVTYDLGFRKYHHTAQGGWMWLLYSRRRVEPNGIREPISEEIFAVRQENED